MLYITSPRFDFSQGDLNETLFVGEVDEQSKFLTKVTHESLMKAIEIGKFQTNCLVD